MTYQFNPFTNNLDIVGTGGGGGSVTTIDGDTGSITGSTVTIYANNAALNSGSSVSFVNSGTISTLNVSDANNNTIIGAFAGNLSISGNANCAYGLQSATGLTSGSSNNFFGNLAGTSCTSGSNNNFLGAGAGGSVSSGNFNLILGDSGANSLLTGSYNVILGPTIAGSSYTTSESSNILVANAGVVGESHVMRIGTAGSGNGQVNKCFVAGINGNTVSSPAFVTINTSTGQLGTSAGSGGITTINGDSGSITGSTVTIETGVATLNSGSTVKFVNSGTTSTLNLSDSVLSNTFLGNGSGIASLTAQNCVGVGSLSCGSLTSGDNNTAIGQGAGFKITSGADNAFIGAQSGVALTTGSGNTATGYNSLGFPSFNGSYNTVVGYYGGYGYTGTESSNVVIGSEATVGDNNTIRIGSQGGGLYQQNTCFIAGIHGSTVTGSAVLISSTGQLGDIVSSAEFKENIQDISESENSILNCHPVSFNYKADPEKKKCYGMIAEEVEKVFPDLVIYKDGAPYSIKYHEMPALLLAEIQKLRAEIDLLKKGQ